MLPTTFLHVARFHKIDLHQGLHLFRLEQQMRTFVAGRVLGQDQIGQFIEVIHGIGPAAQAGFPEGGDARRMLAQLRFRREERIPVEVDAAGLGEKTRTSSPAYSMAKSSSDT